MVRALLRLLTTPLWWLVRGPLLDQVLDHVARAGFMPQPFEKAGGRLAGIVGNGRVLTASDTLPAAETHYLRHVVKQVEWPTGTTLAGYVQSLEGVIRDRASGVIVSRFRGQWHLASVRRSGPLQGPNGYPYVMVSIVYGQGIG